MEGCGIAIMNVGFPPVINSDSKVLILGSFPSVKSREVGFYYGNPQNRFWRTLSEWANVPLPEGTEEKKAFILSHKIALWDVIEKSDIKGSSDGNINDKNSVPADICSVLSVPKRLKLIICNGKKAYSVFANVCKKPPTETICLSSTSSANPRFNKSEWLNALDYALK